MDERPYLRWMPGTDAPVPDDEVLEALAKAEGRRWSARVEPSKPSTDRGKPFICPLDAWRIAGLLARFWVAHAEDPLIVERIATLGQFRLRLRDMCDALGRPEHGLTLGKDGIQCPSSTMSTI